MSTEERTAPDDALGVLEELLGGAKGDDSIQLLRSGPGGGYICTMEPEDPADFLELVKQRHGPGKYQIRLMRRGKYAGAKTFRIAGTPRPRADDEEEEEEEGAPSSGRLELELERRFLELEKRLNPRGSSDALLAALLEGQQALTATLMAKVLEGPKESGGVSEMLKILREGIELGKGGGGGDDDPYRTLLPAVLANLSGAQAAPPAPAPASTPAPMPNPTSSRPFYARHLPAILAAAEQGVDPRTAAHVLGQALRDFPDELAYLEENADDLPALLAFVEPRMKGHRAWVEKVVDELFPVVEDSEDVPNDP